MNADWHPDPTGRHELRYWDGSQWTEHVSDQGTQSTEPLDLPGAGAQQAKPQQPQQSQEPQHQHTQPQGQAQGGYGQQPQGGYGGGQQPQGGYGGGQQPPGDAFAGIKGDLVDGRFAETEGPGPRLQNSKMLRVRVTEPFMARQGSMVAYQGNVQFHFQGGGAGRFVKKALTGEGLPLMRVEGQGDVFIADTGKHVHLLHLENTGISANGKNVLAFSASMQWNIERVKGGSMLAGGLFNTTIRGTGWVAIVTDGEPVVLNAAEAPTFADTDAIVAWSAHLDTSLKSTMSLGGAIGRGSGEALQVAFQGQGFVIVQPSEGINIPGA
ncbi:AIM24 family protein [Nocardioides litoris]|uniref:AIM24 family protein n=1 Tax=Nocardioides litoris TaxID=1926648 RepID=UPI00111CF24E|nr:AIM24 family protein [Nocardioides litoris]